MPPLGDIEDLPRCDRGARWTPPPPPPAPPTQVCDVAIVGAGAVGCAVARRLSQYDLRTVVLDRADDVAQGASKANSGIVHGGYDERHGTLKASVACVGNAMFADLDRELHFGFRRTGALVVAMAPEEVPLLEGLKRNGELNGVRGLEILGREQIREMEPSITRAARAALHCPSTGIVSPYEYVIALAENAVTNGVDIFLSHEVVDIQRTGDPPSGFLVKTDRGRTFRTTTVVNAAGLHADKVAAMVGANNFSIEPRKGEYLILDRSQAHFCNRVLFPVPSAELGKGILVSQTYHGNLLLGPTSRGTHEASLTNRQVLQTIVTAARRVVPDVDVGAAITSFAGLRAKSSRRDFIVEESPVVPRFVNVAGIDSPGLTSSPAVAVLVVDILRRCGLPLRPNPRYRPERRPIVVRKGEDFDGAVDHPSDPAKNVVCRCERVTEAEIVDALHRPLCGPSTDAVKRRTRAGMGPCQGTFCEPRVVRLIAREKRIPEAQVARRGAGTSVLPHRRMTPEDRALLDELSRTGTSKL